MQFQRILYLEHRLFGGSRSLACALRIARDHGASLTVAGVVAETRGRWSTRGGRGAVADRWRREVESRARQEGRGEVDVAVRLIRERAVRGAVAGHDLLLTVARRESLRWPLRYAPAEREYIRGCGCPVWVLHPAQSARMRVVVAGLDVSARADDAMAGRVVRTAARLAEAAGAELHVVHAYSVTGESLIGSRNRGGSRDALERVLESEEAERRARLHRILDRERIRPSPTVVLRHGRTVSILEDVAWRREADLVVVGASAQRDGLGLLLFPSTGEQLLGRVPASMVVVGGHPAAHGLPLARGPTARSA